MQVGGCVGERPRRSEKILPCCPPYSPPPPPGDIVMHMRKLTGTIHNRDKLMGIAFDGIGSLPMATIDKFREMRAKEFAAGGGGAQGTVAKEERMGRK